MSREDICNVEPVSAGVFREFVSPVTGLTEMLPRLSHQTQPDPTPEEIAERCQEVLAIRRARETASLDAMDDDECDALDLDARWLLVGEGEV